MKPGGWCELVAGLGRTRGASMGEQDQQYREFEPSTLGKWPEGVQMQPNCECVPAGAMIYPDDFEIRGRDSRRFAESLGREWGVAEGGRWQRERSRDPFLPAIEAKIAKLLPQGDERLQWELRTAKRQYAETLGRILKQLEGGE
jgi:hypothetical protein